MLEKSQKRKSMEWTWEQQCYMGVNAGPRYLQMSAIKMRLLRKVSGEHD